MNPVLHIGGPVARLSLNRPESHNALDAEAIQGIAGAFDRLSVDSGIRVVILSGEGRSFCAGADLGWMRAAAGYSVEENLAGARALQMMLEAIDTCPLVTIARVHGAAMGGGIGLAAACDVVIGAADTRFAFSEVRLGLAPAVIAPYVLRRVPMGAARALFVTGERFSAAHARWIGLVDEVVEAEGLDAAVESRVTAALQCGPQAVAASKRLLREIEQANAADAGEITTRCIAELRAGPEAQEGIRAFFDKRKPSWAESGGADADSGTG